jgi:hypothetical protein
MNAKVEYISKLFQKTSFKALENYCLTRLWHKLDNDEIKFVPQQYVNRHTNKYALTDVYLPQFQIHIEVNEPAHYDIPERILADQIRKTEIEQKTGHRLFVIDCRKTLLQIHEEIECIVEIINNEIIVQKLNGTFKPWQPDVDQNPNYWKAKQTIDLTDNISLRSIEDICLLFNADFNKTKRGFLRKGAVAYPNNENYIIWWPAENNRSGWINTFSNNDDTINESHSDNTTRSNHYHNLINTTELRIVFFHEKDVLGIVGYKFKGIYEIDRIKSNALSGLSWKRVSSEFKII